MKLNSVTKAKLITFTLSIFNLIVTGMVYHPSMSANIFVEAAVIFLLWCVTIAVVLVPSFIFMYFKKRERTFWQKAQVVMYMNLVLMSLCILGLVGDTQYSSIGFILFNAVLLIGVVLIVKK